MDLEDFLQICFASFLVILICFVLCFLFNILLSNVCTVTTKIMNKDSSYTFMTGCMIKVNNEWLPIDNYRKID